MNRNKKSGFSLIELLVVISIIAVITAILLPGLGKTRTAAKRTACASNLRQIYVAMHSYLGSNDDTFPCSNDPSNYVLWPGRKWRSFLANYIGKNIDGNNPSVLWCQQDAYSKIYYDSTSYAYSMTFYKSPKYIEELPIDPCGNHSEQFRTDPPTPQKSAFVSKPSGKILIAEWFSNHFPVEMKDGLCGWWCASGKRNYLFADGHLHFLEANDIRPARDTSPNPNLTHQGIKGIDWPKN